MLKSMPFLSRLLPGEPDKQPVCSPSVIMSALSNVHDIIILLPVIHGHSNEDLPVSIVNFALKLADQFDNDDTILCHISRVSDSIPSSVRDSRSSLSFLKIQHGIDRDTLCHRHRFFQRLGSHALIQ